MSLLANFTALATKRAMPQVAKWALCASTVANPGIMERLPEEEYVNGHLLTGHLQYVDDMLDKTLEIETYLSDLEKTYAEKRKAIEESASWEEMERLILRAETQRSDISTQIGCLKAILVNAKASTFAVDSPDGTSDASEREALAEVSNIINHAAHHEDAARINKIHKMEEAVVKERARDPEHDW